MDYKKKYEEALERAKAGKPMDEVFQELKESEDERIRKMLISLVKHHSDVLEQAHEKEMIAYLEKQKEQKPVEYLNKDKAYAIMTKLTNLSYSKLIPINSDEYKKLHEITSDVRDLLDYPIEQKPAEWSEEDIDKMVTARARKSGTTKSEMEFYRQGIKDTLKSLHPSLIGSPARSRWKYIRTPSIF